MSRNESLENIDIDELMSIRKKFDHFVYTPLDEALEELKKRREDKTLEQKILQALGGSLPDPLKDSPKALLFRQLATPNYEIRRLINIIEAGDSNLEPCFWEYYGDKFTSNNKCKHSLGKMMFYKGRGKKGGEIIDRLTVIDFNKSNGNKISEVETLWGQSLIDFHHELFKETFIFKKEYFFDATEWFQKNGGTANNYYEKFLFLFLSHGILFENFLPDEEADLIRDTVLPAFMRIHQQFNLKPLIVALEPTNIESSDFWNCHPHTSLKLVNNRMTL